MRLWKNTEEIWWRTPDPASWIGDRRDAEIRHDSDSVEKNEK